MKTSFYTDRELKKLGLASYGYGVKLSRYASIYSPEKIKIGNNVRIDDFCILSGKISIQNNVHIAAFSALYGGDAGIVLGSFVNVSGRVSLYATNDDYSGESLPGAVIPEKYKKVVSEKVEIEDYSIIGCNSVVLPGVVVREGSALGCFSYVTESTKSWYISVGIPVKPIKKRDKTLMCCANDIQNFDTDS